MTDRELLELAAKAAGHPIDCGHFEAAKKPGVWWGWVYIDGGGEPPNDSAWTELWNPLTDDGDALRLAVKLCIGIDHNRAGDQQRYVVVERPGCEGCFAPVCCVESEFDENNRASATRRAIVRAAAATIQESNDEA